MDITTNELNINIKEPLHGFYRVFDNRKELIRCFYYVKGKLEGLSIHFINEGKLIYRIYNYKDSLPHGAQYDFSLYPKNKVSEVCYYSNGLLNGINCHYSIHNYSITYRQYFINNIRHGLFHKLKYNGEISDKGFFNMNMEYSHHIMTNYGDEKKIYYYYL